MNMKVQLIGIALIVFSVFCAVVHAAHLAEFFIVGLVSAILGLILCFVGLCMTGSKEEDKEKKQIIISLVKPRKMIMKIM